MDTATAAANEVELEVFVEALDQMTLDGVLGAALMLIVGMVIIRIVMTLLGRLIKRLPPEKKLQIFLPEAAAMDTIFAFTELAHRCIRRDMFEIKENTVILYYNDIPLIAQANFRDADDWDEWEVNSDIAYEVDKWDIIDTLYSIVSEEEFPENMEDFTEEQADEWWEENLETILRKYQQKVLDEYEYNAIEYGQSGIDGEQILRDAKADYEDDRYHQMKNERYDDDFDMSTRSLL